MGGYDFRVRPVEVPDVADMRARTDAAKARKIELQQRQIELDKAKRQQADEKNREAAAVAAYQPISYTPPQTGVNVGGASLGYQPATVQGPEQFNRGSYIDALRKTDPFGAMQQQNQFQLQDIEHQKQMAALSEQFSKTDQESLKAFNAGWDTLGRYLQAVDQAPENLKPQIYAGALQHAAENPAIAHLGIAQQVPPQYDPQSFEMLKSQFMDVKQAADLANKNSELRSKTVQTADGVQQFNPATNKYDQNIGKLPKTVPPGVNVNLNGGAGQDVQLIDQKKQPHLFGIAQDLAYGKLTLQQMKSLYGYSRNSSAQRQALYATAQELNPNFDPAQFEMGFKFAANPKVRQQMASLDNVASGVHDLLKLSDEADRSGVKLFNDLIIKGGAQVSGKKYSNLQTARTAFADELSGALGYGSATDMSREMGFNMTDPNLSAEAFRSAIQDVVVPFVQRKKASLLGQMGPYGSGSGPTLTNQNPPSGTIWKEVP